MKSPINAIDGYKTGHKQQYPDNTTEVYSNFTPRSSKYAPKSLEAFDDKIVFFGLQYFIKQFLIEDWQNNFFSKPKDKAVKSYARRLKNYLGSEQDTNHIEALHDLGYLPLEIKALPEGSVSPIKVPVLTIKNTIEEFFWLTNYLETIISCYLWLPITTASTARQYRMLIEKFAHETGGSLEFIPFQGHDFSFRGMSSYQSACISGAAHLTSFAGTDTVPAIDLLEDYYGADSDKELVGCSVPATEHSVMCMGTKDKEIETFRRLINKVYPTGIVSIVSDTWDFWQVITEFMKTLKQEILSRDGKVVIRPDSGDPVKIVCGDEDAPAGSAEYKGAIECLWEIFGGTVTDKGYKTLDSHIGLIYGDSITLERAGSILSKLKAKGFASDNLVFGIGSYTYQYVTRDSYGFAMKATSGVVDGERRDIFKEPKTDDGTKKSARGLLVVDENFTLHDRQTEIQENTGILQTVFLNGKITKEFTLQEIRERVSQSL